MSRILTLNIGASKATLAEYVLSGKRNLTLTAYGSADLQTVDVNDALSISASLPPVISQIMRETGIRPAPLVVSLGGQMVFPRFAKFPPVGDKAKLEQLVNYEVEQNVPFPIDEIVCDHQFLGTSADGDLAAMIVAAKLDGVRAVTDAVAAAGMKAAVVDVSPIAVLNALHFSQPRLTGCSVVLDIGSKTTNLILIEGEKVYNRSIPVAGNTITKEIAQTFGCSFEEAEQLKIERGYVALGGVTEDADEITDRVSKVVRTVLTRLHAEISRSINFYRSQQGGAAPSRLFLTGGTVRLPQLDQFFMESLQVDVEYLNPFTAVTPSSFAATIIAARSPSGVVPRNWWSQTISSIGNGTFCSTSYWTSCSSFAASPTGAIFAKRGKTICPPSDTTSGAGRMPVSCMICERTGGREAATDIASFTSTVCRLALPYAVSVRFRLPLSVYSASVAFDAPMLSVRMRDISET